MEYIQFEKYLVEAAPPPHFSQLQQAVWYAAKGNWEAAHNIAQQHEGEKNYDLLHAYLHRVEGDDWNADYWYRRAGATRPALSIDEELKELIERF